MKCLEPHIDARKQLLPTRIRFDFTPLPGEQTLALANRVAKALRRKLPETVWIDSLWNWRASGGLVVGVVGHRDLTAFGGIEPVTDALRQNFMDLIAREGVEQVVTGCRPGRSRGLGVSRSAQAGSDISVRGARRSRPAHLLYRESGGCNGRYDCG